MRLLSYNIHKGIGGRDRLYKLERIIAVIARENPDLICLQEVDRNVRRSHYQDQPRLLAEIFDSASHLFQLNVSRGKGGYGNLILSRWPLRSHHHISLRQGHREPRGAQIAVIETPEGLLHLTNWHLGLAEKERHWQAEHLLKHRLFHKAAHLPTLVVGDCNDWLNTLVKSSFSPRHFHQATSPPSAFRSFPAFSALTAIDKVFYRGAIHLNHTRIVRTQMARIASDHLPLIIDFNLTLNKKKDLSQNTGLLLSS